MKSLIGKFICFISKQHRRGVIVSRERDNGSMVVVYACPRCSRKITRVTKTS